MDIVSHHDCYNGRGFESIYLDCNDYNKLVIYLLIGEGLK